MRWKKVTLVGVGLLGGSLGLALRQRRLAEAVVGYVRRPASIAECRSSGAVQVATCDLAEAVRGADLIVLCTPVGQMRELAQHMSAALKRGAVVTDVGSVKGSVVKEVGPIIKHAGGHFVGSHPMAGSEKSGVSAARANLFESAVTVVTPVPGSNRSATRKVEQLWSALGSKVLKLSPTAHDRVVSRSSHLPHIVAAVMARFVLSPRFPQTQSLLCANGFKDSTRIASGSPKMWRDIALANRKSVARSLSALIRDLQRVERLLADGDSAELEKLLEEAKQRRDAWQMGTHAGSPE